MREHKKNVRVGIGASSIMMIFVVLCMMILSVLSYHTALQKEHITQRAKQVQEEYSKADALLQFVINEVFDDSNELLLKDEDQALLKKYKITYEMKDDALILICRINEQQILEAELVSQQNYIVIKRYETKTKGV